MSIDGEVLPRSSISKTETSISKTEKGNSSASCVEFCPDKAVIRCCKRKYTCTDICIGLAGLAVFVAVTAFYANEGTVIYETLTGDQVQGMDGCTPNPIDIHSATMDVYGLAASQTECKQNLQDLDNKISMISYTITISSGANISGANHKSIGQSVYWTNPATTFLNAAHCLRCRVNPWTPHMLTFLWRELVVCTETSCPTNEEVICASVTSIQPFLYQEDYLATPTLRVDCKGAIGKFVRVQLNGNNGKRVFPVVTKIDAYRKNFKFTSQDPKTVNPDTPKKRMVCYAVEMKPPGEIIPSFHVSSDPQDNIFYSTCLRRRRVDAWLPLLNKSVEPAPRFVYGSECVSCDSYNENKAGLNVTTMHTPQWQMDDMCIDCVAADRTSFTWWDPSDYGGNSKEMPHGSTAGIVIGVLVFSVGVVATAVYLIRKKWGYGGSLGREKAYKSKSHTRLYSNTVAMTSARIGETKQMRNKFEQMHHHAHCDSASPTESIANSFSPTASGALLAGWEEHADDDGTPYYYNTATGESTWDRPTAGLSEETTYHSNSSTNPYRTSV